MERNIILNLKTLEALNELPDVEVGMIIKSLYLECTGNEVNDLQYPLNVIFSLISATLNHKSKNINTF